MAPMTILVVDDDPVIRRLLTLNFEMEGYDVITANDGLDGLSKAKEKKPAAVVLDVMMPRMDGIEVTRALKGDPETSGIPVLLLSAKAQTSDVEAGMAAGADDYVTKPFEPLDLLKRVASRAGRP